MIQSPTCIRKLRRNNTLFLEMGMDATLRFSTSSMPSFLGEIQKSFRALTFNKNMFLTSHLNCLLKYVGPDFFRDKAVLVLGRASAAARKQFEEELACTVNCLKCDILLHWGMLSQLDYLDAHIEHATKHATYMILETEVLDTAEAICTRVTTGFTACAKPSASYVESMLRRHGWSSRMIVDKGLNTPTTRYDWPIRETWQHRYDFRRVWICWKDDVKSPIFQ